MRVYSAASMEDARARKLLREWRSDGLLTEHQYEELAQQTAADQVCDLRSTNVFLRVVLFFFTLLFVGATAWLFLFAFLSHSTQQATGVFLLVFSVFCYVSAEVAVSQGEMYRYGIEEAMAVSSVGYLCAGLSFLHASGQHGTTFMISSVGAIASLWIWHRFGLWYAFLAAMIFGVFVAGSWAVMLGGPTGYHTLQRVLLAALYGAGLMAIRAMRPRHRFDYLDGQYSVAEALLWLGLYLAINLKVDLFSNPIAIWQGGTGGSIEFPTLFYWVTWALTWCLPPVVLMRGLGAKDRFVLGVGLVATVLTFISNKPYLGWARHTWDPMLLGVFLTGAALSLRRWLAGGTGGIRHGFTSARLSGRDCRRVHVGASVIGMVTPHAMTPSAQVNSPEFKFGGGASGGGGATGDF